MTIKHEVKLETMVCPACGCMKHSLNEVCKGYEILTCLECGLCFCNPMRGGEREFYKNHVVYRKMDKATIAQHCNSAAKSFNQHLLTLLSEGDRILDIGCGFGAFVKYAAEKGYDAYGIDFNDKHINIGREVLGLGERLILGDIKDLHDSDRFCDSFDLVTLFEVIEHVEDPRCLVQDARRMLSKGGLLAISCPNESRWQPTGRIFADYPPHHLTRWRPDTLLSFLERQGFQHVKTQLECSFSDLIWVAYVNSSAKRKEAKSGSDNGNDDAANYAGFRRLKIAGFNLIRAFGAPFDLVLKTAGVGTMGMRMVVRRT